MPHRYDAIVCLFGSIGYLQTIDRVIQALRCFREHLSPGGIIIVEPWLAPGRLDPSRVTRQSAEADAVRVSRECRVQVEGRMSRLCFEYEISHRTSTTRFTEVHELGLFTMTELLEAFQRAELDARHQSDVWTDRGRYIATRTGQ